MMRLNLHVGPVRIQMNSTQQIPDLQVFSTDSINSKGVNVDKSLLCIYFMEKSKSKVVIVNACSLNESE